MKIARVNNLNEEIKYLKEYDIWVYGTAIEATKYYYEEDLKGAIALVIGNEGEGMSRLVKDNCDVLLKIPMKGSITSLNASVKLLLPSNTFAFDKSAISCNCLSLALANIIL